MQDFTGVPAVADFAAMRNALKSRGIEPKKLIHYLELIWLLIILLWLITIKIKML